jgi:hypothetical protein
MLQVLNFVKEMLVRRQDVQVKQQALPNPSEQQILEFREVDAAGLWAVKFAHTDLNL